MKKNENEECILLFVSRGVGKSESVHFFENYFEFFGGFTKLFCVEEFSQNQRRLSLSRVRLESILKNSDE